MNALHHRPRARCALALLALGLAGLAVAVESPDNPFMTIEGAEVSRYREADFDLVHLPVKPIPEWKDVEVGSEVMGVEGAVRRYRYRTPENISAYHLRSTLKDELERQGYSLLFECAEASGCGSDFRRYVKKHDDRVLGEVSGFVGDPAYAVTAKKRTDSSERYVFTVVRDDGDFVHQVLVQARAEAPEIISVADSAVLGRAIEDAGQAVVRGILFELDSASIKSQSEPALRAVADLLSERDALEVFVVGHTDSSGTLDHNMTLSRRRAEAVTQFLVDKLGIDRERLEPRGLGPLAPVASNATEDGRAANRRVAIVAR